VVVKIEQDSIAQPAESIHRSHNLANANKESSCIPRQKGCFSPAVTPPLETPIGRNQAATADECISVSGLFSDRLLTRVDGAAANTGVLVRSCSEVPIDIVVNFEVFRDHFACVRWWSRNADASFDASRAI